MKALRIGSTSDIGLVPELGRSTGGCAASPPARIVCTKAEALRGFPLKGMGADISLLARRRHYPAVERASSTENIGERQFSSSSRTKIEMMAGLPLSGQGADIGLLTRRRHHFESGPGSVVRRRSAPAPWLAHRGSGNETLMDLTCKETHDTIGRGIRSRSASPAPSEPGSPVSPLTRRRSGPLRRASLADGEDRTSALPMIVVEPPPGETYVPETGDAALRQACKELGGLIASKARAPNKRRPAPAPLTTSRNSSKKMLSPMGMGTYYKRPGSLSQSVSVIKSLQQVQKGTSERGPVLDHLLRQKIDEA